MLINYYLFDCLELLKTMPSLQKEDFTLGIIMALFAALGSDRFLCHQVDDIRT